MKTMILLNGYGGEFPQLESHTYFQGVLPLYSGSLTTWTSEWFNSINYELQFPASDHTAYFRIAMMPECITSNDNYIIALVPA